MAIRMTGLNSGLDTDAIVQALMSAKRTKQTKIKSKQTKLEWKKKSGQGLIQNYIISIHLPLERLNLRDHLRQSQQIVQIQVK